MHSCLRPSECARHSLCHAVGGVGPWPICCRQRAIPAARSAAPSVPTLVVAWRLYPWWERGWSVDHADTVASAKLFDAGNERPVGLHIIAFRLQHHQKVTRTLHIEQHLGRTLSLDTK